MRVPMSRGQSLVPPVVNTYNTLDFSLFKAAAAVVRKKPLKWKIYFSVNAIFNATVTSPKHSH
jgi:hypothetical protein